MAVVMLEGVFMGVSVKSGIYDGKEKSTVLVDVYQPTSEDSNKMVQVRSSDLTILNTINKEYAQGSLFKCVARVNAYKNAAYYNLLNIQAV